MTKSEGANTMTYHLTASPLHGEDAWSLDLVQDGEHIANIDELPADDGHEPDWDLTAAKAEAAMIVGDDIDWTDDNTTGIGGVRGVLVSR